MKTLEQYLRDDFERSVIDHTLRASVAADGRVTFYVHPQNVDGDTPCFEVAGNTLAQNRDVAYAAGNNQDRGVTTYPDGTFVTILL